MIRSSANLESDDIHVRCRVRRSPYASNPEFDQAQEMTCIMRNWQPMAKHQRRRRSVVDSVMKSSMAMAAVTTRTTTTIADPTNQNTAGSDVLLPNDDAHQAGPELILQSVQHYHHNAALDTRSSNCFQSFSAATPPSSRRRASEPAYHLSLQQTTTTTMEAAAMGQVREERQRASTMGKDYGNINTSAANTCVIALSDIIVADIDNLTRLLLCLTTHMHGYLEFSFTTANARDTLVAFLSTYMPKERLVFEEAPNELQQQGATQERSSHPYWQDEHNHPLCATTGSLDVEMLTANRIEEQAAKHESLSEMFRRRVANVAFQLGEMSTAFSECACGGLTASTSSLSFPVSSMMHHENVNDNDDVNNNEDWTEERRQSPPRLFMEIAHSADEVSTALSASVKKSNSGGMDTVQEMEPEMKLKNDS